MKNLYVGIAWAMLSFMCCCCQRDSFQAEAISQDYITFGKGGGMTNLVETFYILANGRVYKHNSLEKKYQPLGRLKRSARKACFARADELSPALFQEDQPGNIYYFVNIHTQDTVKSTTWGSQAYSTPEAITSFYQYTQQLVNDLSL